MIVEEEKYFIFLYRGYCTVSVVTVGTVEWNSRIYLGTVEEKRGENGKDNYQGKYCLREEVKNMCMGGEGGTGNLSKEFEGSVNTSALVIDGWLGFSYEEGFDDG